MPDVYAELLELLRDTTERLRELTALAEEKIQAVRQDDLAALEKILNQEQAAALVFRGLEQKRQRLLTQGGLDSVPLVELHTKYPPETRLSAKQTAEELRRQYRLYSHTADVARSTLECNLHEIEKILAGMTGEPLNGPGYEAPDVEPPPTMRTDIRA